MSFIFRNKIITRLPRFEYRVHYNTNGLLDEVMFMTPQHCYNWVRSRDIIFLNVSKVERNKLGWSYVEPTVWNNVKKMHRCSWAIVLSKNRGLYT